MSWESLHLENGDPVSHNSEKVTQHLPLRDYFEQMLY